MTPRDLTTALCPTLLPACGVDRTIPDDEDRVLGGTGNGEIERASVTWTNDTGQLHTGAVIALHLQYQ